MYYPEEVVEEVRSRNDIVDVISAYVRLKKQGSSYFGLCPFHGEKTPSFSVSREKQMYYCFGCGAGGNVITFLMQYENSTFPETLQTLADRAGIQLPKEQEADPAKAQEGQLRKSILELNRMAAAFYYYQLRSPSGRTGMDYLQGRHLTPEMMNRFGLGFAPKYADSLCKYLKSKGVSDSLIARSGLAVIDERYGVSDKFWNRVMFPIMDAGGRVIGFGGRVMGDGKPKYLNSPETPVFDKSRNLYGLNYARTARKKEMILCEGYMDVIAMHQAGFTNAVASLGTSLTGGHVRLLSRYVKEVLLCYDSDQAGVRAALRAIPLLRGGGISARILRLDPFKDPDELISARGPEEFEKRIEQAQPSFFFELDVMQSGYDMKNPEAKNAFCRDVARYIAGFDQEIERENYLEAAADRYHISFEGLRKLVGEELMRGIGTPQSYRTVREQKEGKDEIPAAQRLMLTWLCEYPALYPLIRQYISPDDFKEGICAECAGLLFAQLEQGQASPAAIVAHFPDAGDQQRAAQLFHLSIPVPEKKDIPKAIRETLRKVMEDSLHADIVRSSSDIRALQQSLEKKKKLTEIDRLEIGDEIIKAAASHS